MKKTIFTTALFLMAFLNSDAQNSNDNQEKLFSSILVSKTPSNQKGNAAWESVSGGVQTTIGKFAQSDYLEVEIPKMDNIKENSNVVQRVILNIAHQIKLSGTVKAEIEVKLNGSKKWTSFEPITKDFLDITSNGGIPSEILLEKYNYPNKYPNAKGVSNRIFTKKEMKGVYNYDKLYILHIAGTDAKLALAEVPKIEKLRFRLIKISNKNVKDSSSWRIETLAAVNSKYAKTGESGLKGSSETKNKSKLLANSSKRLGLIKIPFLAFVAAGECPEPHPH